MVEDTVVARAAGNGLAMESLTTFRSDPLAGAAAVPPGDDHGPALVVGYATPPDHSYTAALARLCATLKA